MKLEAIKTAYRRNLPHVQPIGACFFVTFRLKGSIPKVRLYELKQEFQSRIAQLRIETSSDCFEGKLYNEQKRYFAQYDQLLDAIQEGPHFLKEKKIADIIAKQLHRYDNDLYELLAYCIMSNHVHILIDTCVQLPEKLDSSDFSKIDFEPLQNIMKRIKGASARYINIEMNRKERVWQKESYDHYVRDEKEMRNIVSYILNNPVKAGLVKEWAEYEFSYVKYSTE